MFHSDCNARDGVVVGASLKSGEHGKVDLVLDVE